MGSRQLAGKLSATLQMHTSNIDMCKYRRETRKLRRRQLLSEHLPNELLEPIVLNIVASRFPFTSTCDLEDYITWMTSQT
jgi:hypothetical protein